MNATKKEVSGKGFLLYTESDLDMNIAAVMKVASGQATQVTDGDITQGRCGQGQSTASALNGVGITAVAQGGRPRAWLTSPSPPPTRSPPSPADTATGIYGKSTKYTTGESFTMFPGLEQTSRRP